MRHGLGKRRLEAVFSWIGRRCAASIPLPQGYYKPPRSYGSGIRVVGD